MKRTLLISCLMALMLATPFARASLTIAQQGASLSASPPTGKAAEIEAYAKEIDSYIKSNPAPVRIFADISSAETDKAAQWREFKSAKERDAASENPNASADVWTRNGKVVGANFALQTPSGDWAQFVMYYFRSDGTLAKIFSTLNTFHGGITVVREDYYNAKGTFLRGTTHCQDLKTQKTKPCADFQDQPAPLYQKISQLPFYSLLKK